MRARQLTLKLADGSRMRPPLAPADRSGDGAKQDKHSTLEFTGQTVHVKL